MLIFVKEFAGKMWNWPLKYNDVVIVRRNAN